MESTEDNAARWLTSRIMKTSLYLTLALLSPIIGAISLQAGTLFYVPIPASESDSSSGISSHNTYTTAVDGGNGGGIDRVINGITLYALTGEGQSLSALWPRWRPT